MNEILKLLQERELYVHLILFKVYSETRGRTNETYKSDLIRELKELFGDDYDREMFQDARHYLFIEGYTQNPGAQALTRLGSRYFENWVKEFSSLEEDDKKVLDKALPEKLKSYLGLTKDALSTINSGKDLILYLLDLTN